MIQTVPTTTTYLLACTNSDIHQPEDMCGGGGDDAANFPMPIFSFEAPTTPLGFLDWQVDNGQAFSLKGLVIFVKLRVTKHTKVYFSNHNASYTCTLI